VSSLAAWRMSYFDLYLIHWPFAFKTTETGSTLYDSAGAAILDQEFTIEDTWKAMEDLVEAGLCKNIGVSNFSISLLKRIISMPGLRVKPAVDQVELHPYLQQRELREFCAQEGIGCEAYSSLGAGKDPSLLEDKLILECAKREGIDPAVLVLSWARQQGIPVIPKSKTAARIAQNFNHHQLSEESMAALNGINKTHRFIDPMNFWKHPMPQ
jgi:diketogulonate reductase-like aldo/keto reductase